ILKFNGLTLYSDELHGYRQFVWVFDSAQIGFQVFWRNFLSNAFTFAKTTGGLVFSIALFALIKIRFRLSEGSQVFKLKNSKIYYRMATFYSLIAFFFLLFLGYYADRLTAIFLPI